MTSKNSLLQFPCNFPLKAIGVDEEDFEGFIISVVKLFVQQSDIVRVERKPSGEGKYISVTVTILAKSQEQLDDLYSELSRHKRVLMLL